MCHFFGIIEAFTVFGLVFTDAQNVRQRDINMELVPLQP